MVQQYSLKKQLMESYEDKLIYFLFYVTLFQTYLHYYNS